MKQNIRLSLRIDGATPEEIARGIAAAQSVFDAAGVTPWDGATGRWKIEGEQWHEITDKHAADAVVWDRACDAALKECSESREIKPDDFTFELLWDE